MHDHAPTARSPAARLLQVRRRGLRLPRPGRAARPAAAARPRRPRRARWRRRRRTSRRRPSGSSSCSWKGPMSQMDTFEYKPQLQKDDGKAGPGGGTLTASKFKFRQHGQTGHVGLRAAARTSPGTSTSSASSAACTPTRRPIRRRSSSCTPARANAALTRPSHGGVAAVRPGHREPGPARLRHHQPAAELRRGGQLRQRASCRPTSRARASTTPGYLPNLKAADARGRCSASSST